MANMSGRSDPLPEAVDAITQLQELQKDLECARDKAEAAVIAASERYSYREIAEAAGVTRASVEWLVARKRPYVRRRNEEASKERRKKRRNAPQEPGKSVREAAAALGYSEAWVRRLADPERPESQRLPSMKGPRTGRLRILGPAPGETWPDDQ